MLLGCAPHHFLQVINGLPLGCAISYRIICITAVSVVIYGRPIEPATWYWLRIIMRDDLHLCCAPLIPAQVAQVSLV
jgi:hypothetical protein